ncbi:excinuclease ABC subunit UvrA [bacterium]|nr:excinuclease ABC subunit UvrA [bacterium]
MDKNDKILINGAREHNLKNIHVEIPRNKLVVITGLSGSGKSSLAFDTIFAEGQRRYVESLSAYARQFLRLMEKPDLDSIEGLSPAVAIQQRAASHNPRSTVATITEIYDYLRLLYSRIGKVFCYNCGRPITQQTVTQIVDQVLEIPQNTRINILAPVIRGRKGEYQALLKKISEDGFVRVRIDGKVHSLDQEIKLNKNKKHDLEILVDRLIMEGDIRQRLTESVETSLNFGEGLVIIHNLDSGDEMIFSELYACPECGISYSEMTPRMFSFNSPYGACPKCSGLGTEYKLDPSLIVADEYLSLMQGAIVPWKELTGKWIYYQLRGLSEHYGFSLSTPFIDLPEKVKEVLLYGSKGEKINYCYERSDGSGVGQYSTAFEGIIPQLDRRYRQTNSNRVRYQIEEYMSKLPCPECGGTRLRKESRNVRIQGKSIYEITSMNIREAREFFSKLPHKLSSKDKLIAERVIKEVLERLSFLENVGVDYLSLDREAKTLSGGESQRIHLATQIGSQLVGVLYILDEPSIGLHQRDNIRLLNTIEHLRDIGNTVIVIEHDRETIERADWIIDLGPGAGVHGGEVVATGTPESLKKNPISLTGQFLAGILNVPFLPKSKKGSGQKLILKGASGNNLRNVNVEFPLGTFICVTGVSGSGKSTLINETLYPILSRHFYKSYQKPLPFSEIRGMEYLDKVIDIDQSPIGRTPRSNPATYTKVFDHIRELYASLPESRIRGYKPGRFSFNVKGGRCEACGGAGQIKLEMHFLPDVYVLCEECKGKRYNRETLEIRYKGKNVADALDMTVDEALEFFQHIPPLKRKLKLISNVGLGYIKLGQSAVTLSGGEAQRVKLSLELSKKATGKTLYILDEPTVGLHLADVKMLLTVLNRLVARGNTVVVIEHNLDVVKTADWIIDLGPEGGDQGGQVIAAGTPSEICQCPQSHTGKYLSQLIKENAPIPEKT